MNYKNFAIKNLYTFKILQNAKRFGVEKLQNEALIEAFLNIERIQVQENERQIVAEIFAKLIKIEEDVQLSR